MEERLLAKSSENISKLLTLMITHEYNIKNHIRNSRVIDMQLIFDRISLDLSQNLADSSMSDLSDLTNLTGISLGGITLGLNHAQRRQSDSSLNSLDTSLNLYSIAYTTFGELENTNDTFCPITQETFHPDDNVALLECGHYFKKDGFMVWARRSRACPICRAYFR